ncbi:Ig-like domain-containing protein [Frondihabitans australicus]|uniref:Bacterial Ig domain-containing protein n=1 Tax=Frondihabitans australicus TaxID=386892 RepID=A0A495ILH2_9MICO|nr:Ig-like domain-containing protein [Frondihabitans australicus]RKR76121.1 hypothetical protein C8E83_3286 [Frondihabitans australicus]
MRIPRWIGIGLAMPLVVACSALHAPAAEAATADHSRAQTTITTLLTQQMSDGVRSTTVAGDGSVLGKRYSSWGTAASNGAIFTAPAPGDTGTIATGGRCLTIRTGSDYYYLQDCTGAASQSFMAVAWGTGVKYVDSRGMEVQYWGPPSGTAIALGGAAAGIVFSTFSVDGSRVDPATRTASITGHGVPGQVLVLDDDVQVTVAADSTWTATVRGLNLGVNRVRVEAWTGGNLLGTQYANADIDVTPLTAAATFGTRVTDRATVSGSAETGATVVVRDAGGHELGRTTANGTTGRYSIAIAAPNAPGTVSVSVAQIVGGDETAPILLGIDYGDELDVTSPINDLIVSGGTVGFTGTGAHDAQITVQEQGRPGFLGATTVLANGRWSIAPFAADRNEHTYVVTQTAPGANVTTQTIRINPGAVARADVRQTNLFDGSTFRVGTNTFTGTGTPGGTITLAVTNFASGSVSTTVKTDGTWSVARNLGNGTYVMSITQSAQGSTDSITGITLTPAGAGVKKEFTTTTRDGDRYREGIVTFTGTGDGITNGQQQATVTLRVVVPNGFASVTTRVASDGTWSLTRNMGSGPYTIQFVQVDSSGATTTIGPFTVRAQ